MVNVKRAVILAAGLSKRLRPLTDNIPKTLIKISNNNTIFDLALKILTNYGINDIVVVTGYASETLYNHIKRFYSNDSIRFTLVNNDKPMLGNIYSFYIANRYMDEDFILLNSDVIFHPKILEYLLTHDTSALAIDDYKELGDEEMKVKVNERDFIKDISKSIDPREADGEYIGIMRLSNHDASRILMSIKGLFTEGKYDLYYEDAIRLIAISNDCFYKCSTRGLQCIEIDTIEDLNNAKQIVYEIEEDL